MTKKQFERLEDEQLTLERRINRLENFMISDEEILMMEYKLEDLYTVDIGHMVCVCNKYGFCVFHGTKACCKNFIKIHKLQPELF